MDLQLRRPSGTDAERESADRAVPVEQVVEQQVASREGLQLNATLSALHHRQVFH